MPKAVCWVARIDETVIEKLGIRVEGDPIANIETYVVQVLRVGNRQAQSPVLPLICKKGQPTAHGEL